MALFQYKIKNDANEFSLTNIIYYRTDFSLSFSLCVDNNKIGSLFIHSLSMVYLLR